MALFKRNNKDENNENENIMGKGVENCVENAETDAPALPEEKENVEN